MMENRLEEIRKRAAEHDPDDPPDNYVFHMMACSDRRWLLGEIDAQREELRRLREALEYYAHPVNWWWNSETNSWIWLGDIFPIMTARRVLTGEFTGKIETVKLYPKALTPEETSNDYEKARKE